VKDEFKKGRPFNPDIFKEASKEIFEKAISLPALKDKVLLFAQATIYRKRLTNQHADLPDEIFEELKTYVKDNSWKRIYSKNGMTFSKK